MQTYPSFFLDGQGMVDAGDKETVTRALKLKVRTSTGLWCVAQREKVNIFNGYGRPSWTTTSMHMPTNITLCAHRVGIEGSSAAGTVTFVWHMACCMCGLL